MGVGCGKSASGGGSTTGRRQGTPLTGGGTLDRRTVERLSDINRVFYCADARAFREKRRDPWPGWQRLLGVARSQPNAGTLSVLDVACGHGRFAAFVDVRLTELGERFRYLGVDASEPLLQAARQHRYAACEPVFQHADPIAEDPQTALPSGRFTLVVLFGFLHHVPSRTLRQRLLAALARRVAPGGLLAFTSWELASHARFRARVVDWEAWNRRAEDPVDLAQLEPGDHLLPWGEDGEAVRYCHFASEEETEALAASLPLERLEGWLADGRDGRLNRYFVLRARG